MKASIALFAATITLAALAAPKWSVLINPSVEIGPIKPMNGVNNGPNKMRSGQSRSNFEPYAALKIPYARVHDANLTEDYGAPHCIDISAIFPDWDADETKPENYDFTITDEYLETMRAAGTEPYYRLGQSIEHAIKKYHIHPPKDYAKWARICEHIIRHYNEGWANGYKWDIKYWEIWAEPDNNKKRPDGRLGPCWTGDIQQFLELYKVTSLHLRKCFGETIKIGGPAFCWWGAWEEFLPFCAKEKLPLDFYSWHGYCADATFPAEEARKARKLLDDNGFTKTENHLNEYNYVKGWSDKWIYSLKCESGRFSEKGAAFLAAVMIDCQNAPLDLLMFYDARVGHQMNNMFDHVTYRPKKGYYPFLSWRRLRDLGTQVKTTVETKDLDVEKNIKNKQLFACAAKGDDGRLAIFLARYTDDNNVVESRRVCITLPTDVIVDWDRSRCYLTDDELTHTETPLVVHLDGTVSVQMMPNSFALIECEVKLR